MKKLMILWILLVLSGNAYPAEGIKGYMEAQSGLANESYGIGGGVIYKFLDGFFGYRRDVKDETALHTFGSEAYYSYLVPVVEIVAKFGLGVGLTIPNSDRDNETLDNGHSWTIGGKAEYAIDQHWAVVGTFKSFFFTTDKQTTRYNSHMETLSNGQEVEVLDVTHHNDSANFDSARVGIALRYYFD